MKKTDIKSSIYTAVISGFITAAIAAQSTAAVAADTSGDDTFTIHGVTLYGTIDMGVAYQSHGAPLSQNAPTGLAYLLQKNSRNAIFSLAPNGMSISNFGLKGVEDLTDDLAAVFKLQTNFVPTSGQITDGPGSLSQQNGVALVNQSSGFDSSQAGQFFSGAAYAGLSSKSVGTFTYGRQNSLMFDNILTYDPNGAALAFSLIGWSGTTGGMGDTEDLRLDSSLKYNGSYGPVHLGALYKFGGAGTAANSVYSVDLGTNIIEGLSFDATYNRVQDAISATSLTSAQVTTVTGLGYLPTSLSATVSDNTTYAFMAKYITGPWKLYAGYEHIAYDNPESPITAGSYTIGGHQLGIVNNTAYNIEKDLQVYWAGVKYSITPSLTVTGAYYAYSQNSYNANGCSDNSASSCSGSEHVGSLVFNDRITKHFDIYAGAMYSSVSDGLANGYFYTNSIDPMIGGRLSF